VVYTLSLAHKDRLFLRDPGSIRRNRARIRNISVPWGYLVGLLAFAASFLVGGVARVGFLSLIGGFVLGFWPGLVANFMRLRREGWTR
jgi:hypothetical protein